MIADEIWILTAFSVVPQNFGAPDKPCGEDARMLTQNCR